MRWLLERFGLYPNSYYNYLKQKKAAYRAGRERNLDAITDIYHTYSGRPGYRMMRVFLERRGIVLSALTVHKYMKELGLKSVTVPKKPRYIKGECYKKFKNLLEQKFDADGPNKKWCTDFTYLTLTEGERRYNCSIIDLYDKSVVATKTSSHIDADLAIDTLKQALKHNSVEEGLILHSDQGSQYTSRAFTEFCKEKKITQSMSKAGCPYDNAPMESYYGTLKAELIRQNKFEDDKKLNEAIEEYAYVWYNHVRPHSSNGYKTPFEKRSGFIRGL